VLAEWNPDLFIDGRWAGPENGDRVEILNPATEETIGQAPVGTVGDARRAIAAARHAFDNGPWSTWSPRERIAALRRFRAALDELKGPILDYHIHEAGIVRSMAEQFFLPVANAHFDFALDAAEHDFTESLPVERVRLPNGSSNLGAGVVVREPIGVVAAIVPFNAPHMVSVGKVGHALAMGNTVVLKPSPYTPFASLLLARAAEMAELPAGVLNVITGSGDVGELLCTSRDVDMISFTGSDAVGQLVIAQSAPTLKKVVLELGGKSAQVVLADADVELAAAAGVANFTSGAGQGCSHRTRHVVHRAVLDEYVEAMARQAAKVVVGDPDDLSTTMGPLINAAQRERVERYVSTGLEQGATVVCGGGRPTGLDRGFFVEPTILTDVATDHVVAREEIFGPVAVVLPVDGDDEAVAVANDSDFGLSGTVWSRDGGRAYDIARRIRTGTVLINGGPGRMSPLAPFGGYKRSGLGREYGRDGLLEYTETKYIGFKAG
jgi:aldehyde dehydrogenase (NAD+)